MSDFLRAEIGIGGKVPQSLAEALCQAIADQRVELAWGDAEFQPRTAQELVAATKASAEGVRLLWLCSDRTYWGEFTRLEAFLREHAIGYTRCSAGKYLCDAERVEYRPRQGRRRVTINSDGQPVVSASRLAKLKGLLGRALNGRERPAAAQGALRAAEKMLRRTLPAPMPPLEPFEILSMPVVEVAHG